MDNTLLSTIMASSVISAFVSSVVIFLSSRREQYIINIVQERKKWRDELREIADDISKLNNTSELKNQIDKLKVRINPFGINHIQKNEVMDHISQDSYFWELFSIYEKNDDEFRLNNNLGSCLIEYISCLLKNDWERSKFEIIGRNFPLTYFIISIIDSFVCIIYWFFTLDVINIHENLFNIGSQLFLIVVIGYLIQLLVDSSNTSFTKAQPIKLISKNFVCDWHNLINMILILIQLIWIVLITCFDKNFKLIDKLSNANAILLLILLGVPFFLNIIFYFIRTNNVIYRNSMYFSLISVIREKLWIRV